jgi:ABC-2 type transport system ATP-binding protein
MKQKLAIANALLPRPELLLLDEPTAGVDVVARGEIWTLLTEERRQALVLLSTSYLDEAERCDRLVYLDDGRVAAEGTPADLRAAVSLDVYRAWGDDARAIARAARALGWVHGARATGRFARIEVRREATLGRARVLEELRAVGGGIVRFAEQAPADMEAAFVAIGSAA